MGANNFDINSLLAMLDNEEMMEKAQQLQAMFAGMNENKSDHENENNANDFKEFSQMLDALNGSSFNTIKHNDPKVNLLIALKPFISSEFKKKQIDEYINLMNMSHFVKTLSEMTQKGG